MLRRLVSVFVLICLIIALLVGCAEEEGNSADELDIDFTSMSDTMIGPLVINMFTAPDGFVGQRVRMSGMYEFHAVQEHTFHLLTVVEGDGCCDAVMFEFQLNDETTVQEGVLQNGTNLEVTGVIRQFEFNNNLFLFLDADEIKVS